MGFFDDLGKVAKAAASATKSVVKSPITKSVVGVTAVVYPPVGVPAAAAVAVADKTITELEKGNATAKKAVVNTTIAAQKGDGGARRMLQTMALVKRARGKYSKKQLDQLRYRVLVLRQNPAEAAKAVGIASAASAVKAAVAKPSPPKLRAGDSPARKAAELKKLKKALDDKYKAGVVKGKLEAIVAMRNHQLKGIMMGEKKIAHGAYAPVP